MKEEVKNALKVIEQATANCAVGDRHIAVLDRGWVFVGNMSKKDDVYTLSDCQNVRKWDKGGFGLLSQSATKSGATLDRCATIRFKESALIFAVPVGSEWDD